MYASTVIENTKVKLPYLVISVCMHIGDCTILIEFSSLSVFGSQVQKTSLSTPDVLLEMNRFRSPTLQGGISVVYGGFRWFSGFQEFRYIKGEFILRFMHKPFTEHRCRLSSLST